MFKNSNKEKARKKRIPLAGYPWNEKFKTTEDIAEYYGGDRIQCLLCGRWFRSLGHHVSKIHEITPDEYKTCFGLPYNRGLSSKKYHDNHSKTHKELYQQGVNPLAREDLRLKGSALAKQQSHKRRLGQPFNKLRQKDTHKHSSSIIPKFTKNQIETVIKRAEEQNRSYKDVCSDPGMPSYVVFYKWKRHFKIPGRKTKMEYKLPNRKCKWSDIEILNAKRIAEKEGVSIKAVCKRPGMPSSSICYERLKTMESLPHSTKSALVIEENEGKSGS